MSAMLWHCEQWHHTIGATRMTYLFSLDAMVLSHWRPCSCRRQSTCLEQSDLCLSWTFSTFKTHLKSHLFNISFPSVWLCRWLFFVQSHWSRLCCIRLSKFVIITLHYVLLYRSCTTSQIDRQLPVESIVAWRNRNAVDHVILLGWRCSATNLDPRGSIACLKDALVKVLYFIPWWASFILCFSIAAICSTS